MFRCTDCIAGHKNLASFCETNGKALCCYLERIFKKEHTSVNCFGAKKVKAKWLLCGLLTPVCKEKEKPLQVKSKNVTA